MAIMAGVNQNFIIMLNYGKTRLKNICLNRYINCSNLLDKLKNDSNNIDQTNKQTK